MGPSDVCSTYARAGGGKRLQRKKRGQSNLKSCRVHLSTALVENGVHHIDAGSESFLAESAWLDRRILSIQEDFVLSFSQGVAVLLSRADGALKLLSPVTVKIDVEKEATWSTRLQLRLMENEQVRSAKQRWEVGRDRVVFLTIRHELYNKYTTSTK